MKPEFYRKILSNGMTVILEKRKLPVVSVAFAVKSGARDEKEEEKGISHFIEHMLYKGTKNRTSFQISKEIESNGGELNGFTSENLVAYWAKIPSNKLHIALDVLSDMIKNPLFDKIELEKERNVIFEEIKMYKDNPRLHILEKIKENLYLFPVGMNIAGNFKTMKKITQEKIMQKFNQIYSTNNLVLCVVGDADFNELVEFVQNTFLKSKHKIISPIIKKNNLEKIEKRKGIDQANLVFGYHIPNPSEKKHYAAQILSTLMAGGMSSRLFLEIREKRNLAYAVKSDCEINNDFSYSIIFVGTMKENVNIIKKLILEEFEKVSIQLNQEELNRIKEQMIGNYYINMEDSQSQLVNLLSSEIEGNSKDFYEFEKNIRKVNVQEVKELAKNVKKNYSFFALVPE
jgi:predicted Zn-dependent peptidase